MKLASDSKQSNIRRRWRPESKCNGGVHQEVTLNCKGRSSPILGHYSGVSKLSHLERGRRQLVEAR